MNGARNAEFTVLAQNGTGAKRGIWGGTAWRRGDGSKAALMQRRSPYGAYRGRGCELLQQVPYVKRLRVALEKQWCECLNCSSKEGRTTVRSRTESRKEGRIAGGSERRRR
jgi:hypothetical protein